MNLTRCKKGHFYDTDRFATCPHCQQNSNAGQSKATESIYKEPRPDQGLSYADDVTAPLDAKPMNPGRNTIIGGDIPHTSYRSNQPDAPGTSDETEPLTSPIYQKNIAPEPAPAQKDSQKDYQYTPPTAPWNGYNSPESNTVPVSPNSGQIKGEKISDVRGKINGGYEGGYVENDLRKQVDNVTIPASMPYDDEITQRISFAGQEEKKVDFVVGWLVCVKGNSIGKSFCLRSGKNFIGRDQSMDVVIADDRSVSRNRHAIVTFDPKSNVFLVEPGMSRELFYLDDDLVLTPQLIKAYQVLTIGNTDLMFVPLCGEAFDWKKQFNKNEGK